jgi:uncharacterized protein with ferredoxin domain DUF2148
MVGTHLPSNVLLAAVAFAPIFPVAAVLLLAHTTLSQMDNLRDIDLGIAVGSAAKTAALHAIDCRCQTRVATAARKLGLIQADHAVALSLSMTHKAVGFDRPMPEPDFDYLDLPPPPEASPSASPEPPATAAPEPPGTPAAHPSHPALTAFRPGTESGHKRLFCAIR